MSQNSVNKYHARWQNVNIYDCDHCTLWENNIARSSQESSISLTQSVFTQPSLSFAAFGALQNKGRTLQNDSSLGRRPNIVYKMSS